MVLLWLKLKILGKAYLLIFKVKFLVHLLKQITATQGSKVRSAQIKRVAYSEENEKTRKKRDKEERKKAEDAKKAAVAKETAKETTKP